MSFFFFKNKPSLSLVFDIRDSSVSVAAVYFRKSEKPEMVLCKKLPIKQNSLLSHKKYLHSMMRTVDDAVVDIRKSLLKTKNYEKINSYYFFIGSPWSISKTKTIKIIKDRYFEIDNNILKKIFVAESVVEKQIEKGDKGSDWSVFEEKIIQSKLNGYKIDNIFGKKTSNLAIDLLVSFIPVEIKVKLASYLNHTNKNNYISGINSYILSSYIFLRDLYADKNNFAYVDIGKFITDIYVVRDDIVFATASFPFGEENIITSSLEKTNLSREIFLSHINIGHKRSFDLESHNNVEDLLKTGFDIWKNKLKISLQKMCNESNVPDNLFMIPNSVISGLLYKELTHTKKVTHFSVLGSKVEVSVIGENIINSFIHESGNFLGEPYIKMDLIFLDKMFKNHKI